MYSVNFFCFIIHWISLFYSYISDIEMHEFSLFSSTELLLYTNYYNYKNGGRFDFLRSREGPRQNFLYHTQTKKTISLSLHIHTCKHQSKQGRKLSKLFSQYPPSLPPSLPPFLPTTNHCLPPSLPPSFPHIPQ